MSTNKLLSVPEAAEVLKVSPVRVRQFCQDGRLGKKVGTVYIIDEAELRAFARKKRITGKRIEKS